MSFRRLLNIVYAMLAEQREREPERMDALDRQLNEMFDHELTPEERRRAMARRMMENSASGLRGQGDLLAAMRKHGMAAG